MSKKIRVMAKAGLHSWDLTSKIPQLRGLGPIKKSVLRGLAGYYPNIYPSISRIAAEVGCGTTSARKYVHELENEGWIRPLSGKQGGLHGTVQYEFNVEKLEAELERQRGSMPIREANTTPDDSNPSSDDANPTARDAKPTPSVAEHERNRINEQGNEQGNEQRRPISSSKERGQDAELIRVAAKLYDMGDQIFSGKNHQKLGDLLKTYSMDEIVGAYQEFISNKDDVDMKFAPKGFCEGGAETLIHARRERAANERRSRELYERTAKRLREQADADTARSQQEEAEADRDFKETFGV